MSNLTSTIKSIQDIMWKDHDHDGGFEHAHNVLHKIELLIAGSYPEILVIVGEVFFFGRFFFIGKGVKYPLKL